MECELFAVIVTMALQLNGKNNKHSSLQAILYVKTARQTS